MKKNKVLVFAAIAVAVIICASVFVAHAALSSEQATTILNAWVNGEEYALENDLNNDGKVNVLDAILAIRQENMSSSAVLTGITLDDGYSVDFSATTLSYTVNLPAGRPRIPKVSATAAEGCNVEIEQATIADDESIGYAKIVVSDENGSNTYNIKFVRDIANGFVLQYDDRYTFTPDYTLAEGESFTFVSSDDTVATVDENGVITAENVSDTAVTVKAMVGETEVDMLTVSKIDKAQINLFFVTGQSNAHGCYDFNESSSLNITKENQILAVERPETSGRVYSYDVYPRSENPEAVAVKGTLYDMAEVPRQGFASALGKTYYNLSGEKVVFLQTAYNGSPIERWLDPDIHGDLAEDNTNYYDATQEAYPKLMALLDENLYEINRRANFWLQGETCMSNVWDYANNTWKSPGTNETLFTDEDYANMFLKVHQQMINDFGIESNNILLARAHGSVVTNADVNVKAAINNVRAAQYSLGNNYADIAVVSRLSDYAVIGYSKYVGTVYEPYMGYMGVGNVHYNQTGHNANGRIAAENYFKSIDADTNSDATSVEIINTDGIERLTSDKVFEIEVGNTKRLAAMALPEYSAADVAWSSSDESVAVVSKFGLITVVGEGDAVIYATAENGVKASVNVKGIESTKKTVHYRWDFNGNLSSSADANDLRLSDLATQNGAAENYEFTPDGMLYVDSSTPDLNKPDFTMTFPVTVSSECDWTIEWKADFTGNSVILGRDNSHVVIDGANKYVSHIYTIFSSTNTTSFPVTRPLRFNDSEGNEHFLTYGSTYYKYNIENYAWKLDYTKQSGKITLYILYDGVWTYVDAIEPGTFEATYNNVLGRYHENGLVNFDGWFDYLDIKVSPATITEDAHYRWDFNDKYLESTYDANQLTMTDLSADAGATADIADGVITSTNSDQALRPNYKMDVPVVLTRNYDWSIEWRSQMAGGSVLLGQEENSTYKNCLYAAYTTSSAGYEYGLKLDDDSGKTLTLPYADNKTDAVALNTAWNTWKLEYISSTNTLSLLLYDSTTSTWTTINSKNPTVDEFEKVTFTTLFGRFNAAGLVNFSGSMDYIEIKTKTSVVKEYLTYDWQFTDLTSSEDENTLTAPADAAYTLSGGVYTTTTRSAELAMENAFTLDSSDSWTIEWRSRFNAGTQSNSLFGTECCTNSSGVTMNHIYLAASTYSGDFKSPARLHFGNGSKLDLEFVKGATSSTDAKELTNVWNTWRLVYDKTTRTLSLELYDETNAVWNVCDSAQPGGFSMTFTHMFGDFGSKTGGANTVNMKGEVDYIKVDFVARSAIS